MDRQLLRIKEACEAIGFGETKTRQLISRGLLEVVKIDGSPRVPAESVREFVRRLRQAGIGGPETRAPAGEPGTVANDQHQQGDDS
jgi:excisionase family DNA binding protein